MTKPQTSFKSVDLDDLEREMRRIAVSRRSVGPAKLTWSGGRRVLVAPVPSNRDHKEAPAESGLAPDAIQQGSGGGGIGSIPATQGRALPGPPTKRRDNSSWRALALIILCLLLTGGIGVAMIMHAGPTAGSVTRMTKMANPASPQQVARAAAQVPSPTDGSTNSSQPLDVATSATPATRDTAIPAATTIPSVAADVRPPNPPQPSAETSTLATLNDAVTDVIKHDLPVILNSEPQAAPLPPTRPRTLALARMTSARAASTIGNVTPVPAKEAMKTVAKQSDASAVGAGASSFAIQLASSLSESEALATLSRLKKQFPDALRGGSVRRAQGTDNGVFYGVQSGPLSRDAAENACSRLRAGGENCIVVRR